MWGGKSDLWGGTHRHPGPRPCRPGPGCGHESCWEEHAGHPSCTRAPRQTTGSLRLTSLFGPVHAWCPQSLGFSLFVTSDVLHVLGCAPAPPVLRSGVSDVLRRVRSYRPSPSWHLCLPAAPCLLKVPVFAETYFDTTPVHSSRQTASSVLLVVTLTERTVGPEINRCQIVRTDS